MEPLRSSPPQRSEEDERKAKGETPDLTRLPVADGSGSLQNL